MKFGNLGGGVKKFLPDAYEKLDNKVRRKLLREGKDMELVYRSMEGAENMPQEEVKAKPGAGAVAVPKEDIYSNETYKDYLATWDQSGDYVPAKNLLQVNAMVPLRQVKMSALKNPVTTWKVMSADKLKNLHGRVEESTKQKAPGKVKFVRSGKRWGVIIG